MGFIGNLLGSNNNESSISEAEIIEAGACPNCWGIQEYAGEIRTLQADLTKANLSGSNRKAFIAQFVETNVTGIKLKTDGDKLKCPKCNKKV